MGKMYQRYLSYLYIKNFLIIFFSLEFFYVGVDVLSNLKRLPSSANLQFIYVGLNSLLAVNYALPLGLVFALIATKIFLIRSNELISLYASGISRSQVVFPFFIASLMITLFLIGLNFTPFAKANEYKSNLVHHNTIASNSQNIFVKYKESYIYFKKLNPIQKEAVDIKIFKTKNGVLEEIMQAKKGVFQHNLWQFFDVQTLKIPKEKHFSSNGLMQSSQKSLKALKNFKPTIIDSMQKGKIALSVIEAKDALTFLSKQGANTDIIKSNLFNMVFFPLFAPLMSVILFYHFPPIGRFANLAIFSSISIFITLCTWGIIFVLGRFSANSVIAPEFGIILPIIILGIYALHLFYKHR